MILKNESPMCTCYESQGKEEVMLFRVVRDDFMEEAKV